MLIDANHTKNHAKKSSNVVNCEAGYGLEIPCNYHFYGPERFINKLKSLCEKLKNDGLL